MAETIPVHCEHHKMLSPEDIIPHPRNPNKHPDKQIRLLAKVIQRQGWRSPVVISNRSGFIVSGNGRRLAGIMLGTKCPVEYQDFATEAEELAHLLADNQIAELAEMNMEDMSALLGDLERMNFDVEFAGFPKKGPRSTESVVLEGAAGPSNLSAAEAVFAEEAVEEVNGERVSAESSFEKISPETNSVIQLADNAYFISNLPYGIPALRPDMLGDIPDPINTWIGEKRTKPAENYLWVYGGDSIRGLPLDRATLGFYTDDERFELAWNDISGFTTRLLKLKLRSHIVPNFSLYNGAPTAYYVWNSYRSKYIGRFWQEAGIKVVPDVYIWPEQTKYNWIGIPRKAPCLAMQYQVGEMDMEQFEATKRHIKTMLKELDPQSLFIYTTSERLEQIQDAFPSQLHVIVCINAITLRSAAIKAERVVLA